MNSESVQFETLPALLAGVAQATPEALAVETIKSSVSYSQLQSRSAELAKGLITIGVGKGTRVAILAGNSPFWVSAFFACTRLGALVVPISTLCTAAELAHILRHSDTQVLLAGSPFAGRDFVELIKTALPSLAGTAERQALRLAEAPFLRSVWLEEGQADWAGTIDALVAGTRADPALDDELLRRIEAEIVPADDGVIIYTSGSTALPKAVLHKQGTMARHAQVLARHHFVKPGERVLFMMPMFWVGGLGMLLEVLSNGGCAVLPESPSPRSAVEALKQLEVDLSWGWPTARNPIRELAAAENVDLSHVRGLRDEYLADGSPLQAGQVPNSLGMTETFGPHCAAPAGTLLPVHLYGAFGPLIGGYERRVVDATSGEEVPPGSPGVLELRSGALMDGYYKRERSEVFTPDGYFCTHDVVRIDEDGYLYFVGRTGDMLKTRGVNVSRVEVEQALRQIDGVAEAVVCGLPDPDMGQRVVAAVVPVPGEHLEEEALKIALREQVASYKVPTDIVLITRDDMVHTASGKIRIPEMGELIARRLGLMS